MSAQSAESAEAKSQPPAAVTPPNTVPDKSFYTWSAFFSILTGQATPEDTMNYIQVRSFEREEVDCKRCETHRDTLFQRSPIIRFLQDEIGKLGGDINSENVRCRRCTGYQRGGFDSDYGILLCANYLPKKGLVEDTMAHEMIHAYDHMRFKVDRYNLRHQACTEIRASALSGECRFMREFFKGKSWTFSRRFQECVKRRAALSLTARPECKDDVHAARIVNEVWDSCFPDTRPFDEIYR